MEGKGSALGFRELRRRRAMMEEEEEEDEEVAFGLVWFDDGIWFKMMRLVLKGKHF